MTRDEAVQQAIKNVEQKGRNVIDNYFNNVMQRINEANTPMTPQPAQNAVPAAVPPQPQPPQA